MHLIQLLHSNKRWTKNTRVQPGRRLYPAKQIQLENRPNTRPQVPGGAQIGAKRQENAEPTLSAACLHLLRRNSILRAPATRGGHTTRPSPSSRTRSVQNISVLRRSSLPLPRSNLEGVKPPAVSFLTRARRDALRRTPRVDPSSCVP